MSKNQVDKEKRQLLDVIAKLPHGSRVEWNNALGWRNSKNKVDITKIYVRLKELEADGLVIQLGHRYILNSNQQNQADVLLTFD